MIPTSAVLGLRMATPVLSRPLARAPALKNGQMIIAKRFNTPENRGGRSKLIFRFGLRDLPVELYPIAFITAVALVGAGVAIGRHLYLDGVGFTLPRLPRQR
ncbi:hypothetical protein BD324DRAFT_448418 [Kockovaella imperatae]|uniref:Uncharacterized protein n=1 Tax=Kockovaella imperatae TaxID=4999 RepID=A0A1Y1UH72_9TREE|nr:hypothetical protein BD324DRAFT_448418 [Kockovaella imperatae]ORX37411.1 hypothetical protein BD324DRAFT_448418 [Kockovaella imperatae]